MRRNAILEGESEGAKRTRSGPLLLLPKVDAVALQVPLLEERRIDLHDCSIFRPYHVINRFFGFAV